MNCLRNSPQENKRLAVQLLNALTKDYKGAKVWLDCFMSQTVRKDIAPTFLWQTMQANYDYILEIYEVN